MRLFGERGPEGATVRDIAAAAGVSPALVVRHYGSKDGLREAVDNHVLRIFDVLLGELTDAPLGPGVAAGLADMVTEHLPVGSGVPAYLGRMLLDGGSAGSALFGRLHELSRRALAGMAEAGVAAEGADPAVRAAFLLVNDLAVLILRARLREVLGVDPLSAAGLHRWGAEVLAIYHGGLRATHVDAEPDGKDGRGE